MTAVRRPALAFVAGGLVAAMLAAVVPPAPPTPTVPTAPRADATATGPRVGAVGGMGRVGIGATPAGAPAAGRTSPIVADLGDAGAGHDGRWPWTVSGAADDARWPGTVSAAADDARDDVGAREPTSATPANVVRHTRAEVPPRPRVPVVPRQPVVARRPASPRRAFTIAVTGDLLLHTPVIAAARRGDGTYDFTPLLAGIRRPIASADLALCHLEVPLTRDRTDVAGYPVFNAPAQLADALAAIGYDGCSVASNHAFDRGMTGIRATLRALDRAGLRHAGTARNRREARRTTMHRVGDARVAHLSYTYGLNGAQPPNGRRWAVHLIDAGRILEHARRARRRGADLVVVSLHWGAEYVTAPTTAQRRLADRLLRSRAIDVLVGHHAHVVQPVERRGGKGKVVVFGLGNLLSNQSSACCAAATQDGVIVRLQVRERRDGRLVVADVEYLPTIVRHPDRRVVVVGDALRRGASGRWAAQLRASRQRTRRAIGDDATLVR